MSNKNSSPISTPDSGIVSENRWFYGLNWKLIGIISGSAIAAGLVIAYFSLRKRFSRKNVEKRKAQERLNFRQEMLRKIPPNMLEVVVGDAKLNFQPLPLDKTKLPNVPVKTNKPDPIPSIPAKPIVHKTSILAKPVEVQKPIILVPEPVQYVAKPKVTKTKPQIPGQSISQACNIISQMLDMSLEALSKPHRVETLKAPAPSVQIEEIVEPEPEKAEQVHDVVQESPELQTPSSVESQTQEDAEPKNQNNEALETESIGTDEEKIILDYLECIQIDDNLNNNEEIHEPCDEISESELQENRNEIQQTSEEGNVISAGDNDIEMKEL